MTVRPRRKHPRLPAPSLLPDLPATSVRRRLTGSGPGGRDWGASFSAPFDPGGRVVSPSRLRPRPRWPPPAPRPCLRRLRLWCLLRFRVAALIHQRPGDGPSLGRPARRAEPDASLVIQPDQVPTVALRDDLDLLEAIHRQPPVLWVELWREDSAVRTSAPTGIGSARRARYQSNFIAVTMGKKKNNHMTTCPRAPRNLKPNPSNSTGPSTWRRKTTIANASAAAPGSPTMA